MLSIQQGKESWHDWLHLRLEFGMECFELVHFRLLHGPFDAQALHIIWLGDLYLHVNYVSTRPHPAYSTNTRCARGTYQVEVNMSYFLMSKLSIVLENIVVLGACSLCDFLEDRLTGLVLHS